MLIRHSALEPIHFAGLEVRDYTDGLTLSSSIAEIVVPVGAGHDRAWSRRSDKYYCLLEGSVQFTIGSDAFELEPGDVCVVRQGSRFSYVNTSSVAGKLLLMHTPRFELADEVFVE